MSDSGDWAAWAAAIAAWAGVVVAWRFARRSERAQKQAQKHADRLQQKALDHAEKLHDKAGEREKAARKSEQDAKARDLFAKICALRPVDTKGSNHAEANRLAAELYAALGTDARGRYITCAAMAFFAYGRDTSNTGRMKQLEGERKDVERHLAAPDDFWHLPQTGSVRDWAAGAHQSEGWKGMPWLLQAGD
jgi:hypothetical protein